VAIAAVGVHGHIGHDHCFGEMLFDGRKGMEIKIIFGPTVASRFVFERFGYHRKNIESFNA
jgi:hypothetical protein